jgi:hypothetical protein
VSATDVDLSNWAGNLTPISLSRRGWLAKLTE